MYNKIFVTLSQSKVKIGGQFCPLPPPPPPSPRKPRSKKPTQNRVKNSLIFGRICHRTKTCIVNITLSFMIENISERIRTFKF